MPVGDCQREFKETAAADGIVLGSQSFPWLSQRGHLALVVDAPGAAEALERIYVALGFDPAVIGSARSTALRGDFLHEPTGTLIEIDEAQHFTSARLQTLDLYPPDLPLGFDLDGYKALCRQHRSEADKYRAAKDAWHYGSGGRTRQRAYYDALRDIAAPAMGHPPVFRVAAPHGNGGAAYEMHRVALATLVR